jgi:hypothetical protein
VSYYDAIEAAQNMFEGSPKTVFFVVFVFAFYFCGWIETDRKKTMEGRRLINQNIREKK